MSYGSDQLAATSTRGIVDPAFYTNGRICYATTLKKVSDGYGSYDTEVRVPTDAADATVISSEVYGETWHKPVIDVDIPIRVYPSTTVGHHHLYIDTPMSWRAYKRLLRALVRAGLVEKGYYKASKRRGGSFVRLPWVAKVDGA